MQLNLHLLRIFFEVVRQNGFSRAAEKLFISQPAVSKAVRELERLLDLPLLERPAGGPRGVRLTDAGAALFEHARSIFALERAALEDVQARTGRKRGRLILGASTTIAGYWLAPCLAAMLDDAPDIDVRVQVGNTAAIERALVDCEIDAALVEGPVHDERIDVAHWRDDPMCVVARAEGDAARRRSGEAARRLSDDDAHGRGDLKSMLTRVEGGAANQRSGDDAHSRDGPAPAVAGVASEAATRHTGHAAYQRADPAPVPAGAEINAATLARQTWLMREPGSGTREVAENFLAAHMVEPARIVEIGSNEGIARSVAAGLGIALLPECVVRELLAIGAVCTIPVALKTPLARPLYRITLRARPLTPLVARWQEVLQRER